MIMDFEIISREMIKPSFPTPNHLRNYKLCYLDFLTPVPYAPMVFFYPNNGSISRSGVLEKVVVLKKSLSKTLTRFFPLAGTMKDELSIDCDDRGACFITAEAKFSLSEYLASPDLKLIARFLPSGVDSVGSSLTNIQLTSFKCGGIAIGVCISHRILDGKGLSTFFKCWADFASLPQEKALVFPDFSASSVFPVNDLRLKEASLAMWNSLLKKGQFVTKRFVFNTSAMSTLKDKAMSTSGTTRPTRVETISAFIWKCAVESCELVSGSKRPSLLAQMVNFRKRAAPNFSPHSLGNLVCTANTKQTAEGIRNLGFPNLVHELRNSISKIDGEYIKKLCANDGWTVMHKYLKEIEELGRKGVDHYGFTSWCRMGFYDVDFGWGKPIWITSLDISCQYLTNIVILVDTRYGNGIEAWVTLDEQVMDMMENHQDFQAFAIVNPSPLEI